MTTADMSHQEFELLAVGYAVYALEPADEQRFLSHLPSCAACARAVAEHAETLAHLAYAADPVLPPASLLEGIRAGVRDSGRAGEFPLPELPAVASLTEARDRRRTRTVRATTALLGAAASLVLLVALVFVNRDLQSTNDRIQARDSSLQSAVGGLLAPNSQRVDLTGTGGARAVAVVNGDQVSLVVQGLPANDRVHSTYVLWQRSTFGVTRSVGTFDVASGDLEVVNGLRLTGDPSSVSRFTITQEQGRKAPALAKGAAVASGEA